MTSPYTRNKIRDEFSAAVDASSPPLHTQCHQSIAQVSDDGNRQRREEEERKGRGGEQRAWSSFVKIAAILRLFQLNTTEIVFECKL